MTAGRDLLAHLGVSSSSRINRNIVFLRCANALSLTGCSQAKSGTPRMRFPGSPHERPAGCDDHSTGCALRA